MPPPDPPTPHAALDQLPHGQAFRFISRLVDLTPTRPGAQSRPAAGHAVWATTPDDPRFEGHFPDQIVVPGVFIIEALSQLAGLVAHQAGELEEKGGADQLAAAGDTPVAGMLAHADIRLKRPVLPPADVHLHATIVRVMGKLTQCDVDARVDNQIIAKGQVTIAATT